MKRRNGFVSNSSSSSFIIGLKTITKEDVRKLIPKDEYRTNIRVKLDTINHLAEELLYGEDDISLENPRVMTLKTVEDWLEKYPNALELEVEDDPFEEIGIEKQILDWEKEGAIEIMYWCDRNGDERRMKIFDY